MPNFIDALARYAEAHQASLRSLFERDCQEDEQTLYERFRKGHWHPLPPLAARTDRPAMGVDGGLRTMPLSNGALLIIAQAIILLQGVGPDPNDVSVAAKVLRGSVLPQTASRFADLLRQQIEVQLAAQHFPCMETGVAFLDGALASMLPQLYPLSAPGIDEDPTLCLIEAYRSLFAASTPERLLIAIAKSSRAANLSYILQTEAGVGEEDLLKVPDVEMLARWAPNRAGFSTPVLIGTHGFSSGASLVLLEKGGPIPEMPAIATFYLRPCDFAPPLRIDVPCPCLRRSDRIDEVDVALLAPEDILPIVQAVMADWGGGPDIHNIPLWQADREVALHKDRFLDVYLPILREILGIDLDPTQSAGRFYS